MARLERLELTPEGVEHSHPAMVGTVVPVLSLPPDRFLVFGHRGASAQARENTPAAFRLARQMGADGVELDVRRTADDELIVHHDPVLPGGEIIRELTSRALRKAAPQVVSLDAAMEACAGLIVNVELKNSPADPDFEPSHAVADAVVEWLSDHDWIDKVIVSSFNPATVDRVRHLSSGIATGQLIDPGSDATQQLITAHRRGHQALHPHLTSLDTADELMTLAAGLDMWVLAWTVNDPAAVRGLEAAGITGVITDDPGVAVAARSRAQN